MNKMVLVLLIFFSVVKQCEGTSYFNETLYFDTRWDFIKVQKNNGFVNFSMLDQKSREERLRLFNAGMAQSFFKMFEYVAAGADIDDVNYMKHAAKDFVEMIKEIIYKVYANKAVEDTIGSFDSNERTYRKLPGEIARYITGYFNSDFPIKPPRTQFLYTIGFIFALFNLFVTNGASDEAYALITTYEEVLQKYPMGSLDGCTQGLGISIANIIYIIGELKSKNFIAFEETLRGVLEPFLPNWAEGITFAPVSYMPYLVGASSLVGIGALARGLNTSTFSGNTSNNHVPRENQRKKSRYHVSKILGAMTVGGLVTTLAILYNKK